MKNIAIAIITIMILCTYNLFGQTPIDVAESTLKVSGFGEEIFYYGFSEGDQLVFNFREVNGKELKELEIIELPTSSKFMDYKTKKIENKIINIQNTGVYKFRFANSSMSGRICKFKIQRIPSVNGIVNFNTNVFWRTVFDTTYSIVEEKYLVKSDTNITNLTDQVAKVHSATNANGNRTLIDIQLPQNTIAWSYYVGVDQEGKKAYDEANQQFLSSASSLASSIPGYGSMAALALGATTYFTKSNTGENVNFWFMDAQNANAFNQGASHYYYKQGNVISDYGKMTVPLTGTLYLGLFNDNAIQGIDVMVKVTAVSVNQVWDSKPIQKMQVTSRQDAYLKN